MVSILPSFTYNKNNETYILNYKNKLALFEQNQIALIALSIKVTVLPKRIKNNKTSNFVLLKT
jgi:hypothetical protein